MPSNAENIVARVQAVLLAGPTAAGPRVFRDREDALIREESPSLLIEIVDEDSQPFGGGMAFAGEVDQDELRFAVVSCVRGAQWQQTADALRLQAHALLFADPTLRNLVSMLRRDRCEWKSKSTDLPFGYAAQVYRAKYLTHTTSLALAD
jgi:hypothetical protein